MKPTLPLLAALLLIAIGDVNGQDSTIIEEVRDPASNRLFWMSTGQVMAAERGSIGFMGAPYLLPWARYLTFAQGGYALNSYFQFNLTGSLSYFSIGTKVQPIQTTGVLLRVALGRTSDSIHRILPSLPTIKSKRSTSPRRSARTTLLLMSMLCKYFKQTILRLV